MPCDSRNNFFFAFWFAIELIAVDNGDGEEEQANNTIEIDIEVAMGNDRHDSQMMTQDISDDDDDDDGNDDDDDDAGNRGEINFKNNSNKYISFIHICCFLYVSFSENDHKSKELFRLI